MQSRQLGNLTVSAIGLGCMGMSDFYGPSDDKHSIEVIHQAFYDGVTFFDTANMYGQGHNEKLVGQALQAIRDKVVIASKFGIVRDDNNKQSRNVNASPAYAIQCCEESLQRLNIEYIDLYYLHRMDPTVPIEDTMEALARLVQQGKIRHIGLSEVSEDVLRRAHAVHPVTAVQSEYSLMSRQVERNGILKTCQELNIGFVAYSPLSRALLSGKVENLAADDFRNKMPRFQKEALEKNKHLVQQTQSIADKYNATLAQIALAWVLAQGDTIVPIPGTRHTKYLRDNCAASDIVLQAQDIQQLNALFQAGNVTGQRYSAKLMKTYQIKDE
jgi:aryl-alcohol dehydrogenase-like predicted oxidoreductase